MAKGVKGAARPPYSFGEAAQAYLKRKRRGATTERTATRFMGMYGRRPVSEITSRVVDGYVVERMTEVDGATVRREVTTLMAILKVAHLSGHLEVMPTVVRPEDNEPRLRALGDGEVLALLGVAGFAEEKALAVFMLNTGARVGEAVALQWRDFDWLDEAVTLRTRKGRGVVRERRVPVNGTVSAIVAHPTRLAEAKPFRWASSAAASAALDRLAKASGVTDFTSHDLRRTFATQLLSAGVDVRVVAELLGHTTLAMVMRYAVPTAALKRDAVTRLCSPVR